MESNGPRNMLEPISSPESFILYRSVFSFPGLSLRSISTVLPGEIEYASLQTSRSLHSFRRWLHRRRGSHLQRSAHRRHRRRSKARPNLYGLRPPAIPLIASQSLILVACRRIGSVDSLYECRDQRSYHYSLPPYNRPFRSLCPCNSH